MDLNTFNRKNNNYNKFIKNFVKDLTKAINKKQNLNKEHNVMNEYNRYERRKNFLDNKSWNGNNLVWIMDEKSVCVSEDGDGGPFFIEEYDIPSQAKVGDVYEKINGKYIYNEKITNQLKEIT